MKAAIYFLIPLLAACGTGDGNDLAGSTSRQPAQDSAEPVQVADLTGLYEARGEGGQSARMCMISDPSGRASFGIVTDGPGGASCGGAGEAVRQGNVLRLTMTGDEQCVIEAQMAGTQVTFPPRLSEGCSYYCGPGGTLARLSLEKTGGTAEAAMRATDLAGGPLCG